MGGAQWKRGQDSACLVPRSQGFLAGVEPCARWISRYNTSPTCRHGVVCCRRLVFSDCHQRQWRRQFASLGSRNRLLPEAVAGAQFFGAMCFLLAGMSSWKNLPNIRQVGLLMDAECL